MIRSYLTEAIVLKRRNYGEADRILTVFTKRNGKIKVKAAGVRRITSKRSSHIEPLNFSVLTLYKGHGFPILIEAQTKNDFYKIKEDLLKVGFAYHICELVDGLCPEDQENTTVFSLLHDTLNKLCTSTDIAGVIHDFEISLLRSLGFWPQAKPAYALNTENFIEQILERRLRSKNFLSKIA